jgi:hypothetical protein
MPTKLIASRIAAYKRALASGEIQKTYQSLVGVVQALRNDFAKTYGDDFAVAHILHGYIDVTYFYLQNAYLKKKKLKFAIVLNHQQVAFELWLLGQTKDVQIRYWEMLKDLDWVNENAMPKYSIAEIQLRVDPDFDNIERLSGSIRDAFEAQSRKIIDTLRAYA